MKTQNQLKDLPEVKLSDHDARLFLSFVKSLLLQGAKISTDSDDLFYEKDGKVVTNLHATFPFNDTDKAFVSLFQAEPLQFITEKASKLKKSLKGKTLSSEKFEDLMKIMELLNGLEEGIEPIREEKPPASDEADDLSTEENNQ